MTFGGATSSPNHVVQSMHMRYFRRICILADCVLPWRKELPRESKSWRRLYAVTDQRWQAALLCQMRRTFRRFQTFVRTCVDGTRLAWWHVCYRMPSSSTRNGPRIARRRVRGSQSRFRMVPEELMPRTPRMTSRTRGTSRMCTEHKQAKEGATWLVPPRRSRAASSCPDSCHCTRRAAVDALRDVPFRAFLATPWTSKSPCLSVTVAEVAGAAADARTSGRALKSRGLTLRVRA